MTPAAGALLKLLGSGVGLVRGIGGAIGSAGKTPVEGASFEDLLARAETGTLRSGEPVRVAADAGVDLSAEQLVRVGEAGSRLESRGASRGVILIDGEALEYDVLTRTVTGTVDLDEGVASGIDAVVRAPAAADAASGKALLRSSLGLGAQNRSLLEALSRRE